MTGEVLIELRITHPPHAVLRRLRLPVAGRPGRGKPDINNLWHMVVRYAVDTGAMYRPLEDFQFMMDEFCVHYKSLHGATTTAAAVRSSVSTLRKAHCCGLSPVDPNGRVRPKGKVQQAVKAHMALTSLRISRKKRRPKGR